MRNRNIVWKNGPYYHYFRLNLKYLGWPHRAYIKTAKNGYFCDELLSEKWLVTRTHLTKLKKLQKFHRKKSNN